MVDAMFVMTAAMTEREFTDLAQGYNRDINRRLTERINTEQELKHYPMMELAFQVETEIFNRAIKSSEIKTEEPWRHPSFNNAYKSFIKEFLENIDVDINYNWSRVKNGSVNANHLCARFCKASAQPVKRRSRPDSQPADPMAVAAPPRPRAPKPKKPPKKKKDKKKKKKSAAKVAAPSPDPTFAAATEMGAGMELELEKELQNYTDGPAEGAANEVENELQAVTKAPLDPLATDDIVDGFDEFDFNEEGANDWDGLESMGTTGTEEQAKGDGASTENANAWNYGNFGDLGDVTLPDAGGGGAAAAGADDAAWAGMVTDIQDDQAAGDSGQAETGNAALWSAMQEKNEQRQDAEQQRKEEEDRKEEERKRKDVERHQEQQRIAREAKEREEREKAETEAQKKAQEDARAARRRQAREEREREEQDVDMDAQALEMKQMEEEFMSGGGGGF